jgi:hypothetical protein
METHLVCDIIIVFIQLSQTIVKAIDFCKDIC